LDEYSKDATHFHVKWHYELDAVLPYTGRVLSEMLDIDREEIAAA
jgi:hypothetical protein